MGFCRLDHLGLLITSKDFFFRVPSHISPVRFLLFAVSQIVDFYQMQMPLLFFHVMDIRIRENANRVGRLKYVNDLEHRLKVYS